MANTKESVPLVNNLEVLKSVLNEPASKFPEVYTSKDLSVLCGKTLTKSFGQWKKALLLVDTRGKLQLRLYGWQKNKAGDWKLRQKFNISRGYVGLILQALVPYQAMGK